MGRNFTASRVHRATAQLLAARQASHQPRWFQATSSIPPPEILSRTLPADHSYTQPESSESSQQSTAAANFASYPNPSDYPNTQPTHQPSIFDRPTRNSRRRQRPPKKMFQPRNIAYQEDDLRTDFFTDHPWELARPRTLVETDGKDHHHWDWSLAHQPGRPINGESVIQRQLYLMRADPTHTRTSAYDQARKEFYTQRHREQVERRVAREEADAMGATGWGKTANEVGMLLEGRTFEQFRAWAEGRAAEIEQARNVSVRGGAAESGRAPGPAQEEEEGMDVSATDDSKGATALDGAMDEMARNVPNTRRGQTASGGALFTT